MRRSRRRRAEADEVAEENCRQNARRSRPRKPLEAENPGVADAEGKAPAIMKAVLQRSRSRAANTASAACLADRSG